MKPGDFVSTPYYHYTAYGYIESISDYGTTKVLMAYKYNRNTRQTSWQKSGITLTVTIDDCTLVQSTPYKEDVQELIDIALDNRDIEWVRELHKRGVEA
jgi:hypothetical protein